MFEKTSGIFAVLMVLSILLFPAMTALAGDSFGPAPGAPEVSLFPEPQESILRKIANVEDQAIFLFRELCLAQNGLTHKIDTPMNWALEKALADYHGLMCGRLKYAFLEEPEKRAKFFKKFLNVPDSRFDVAAFSRLFAIMPDSFKKAFASEAAEADAAIAELKDPAVLDEYAAHIRSNPNFYKKAPLWKRVTGTIEEKLDDLISRAKTSLNLVNLIRGVTWLRNRADGQISIRLGMLQERLVKRLFSEIDSELRGEMDLKLKPRRVWSIVMTDGFLQYREALFKGTLRILVKKIQQRAACESDRAALLPLMRGAARQIESLKRPYRNDSNALGYIDMMLDSLKMVMMKVNSTRPDPGAGSDDEFKLDDIEKLLRTCDSKGVVFGE